MRLARLLLCLGLVGAFYVVPLLAATTVDDFTEAVTVDLSAHTPTPGGVGTWVEFEDTAGTSSVAVSGASDFATPLTGAGDARLIYTVDWTPVSADYDVSFKASTVGAVAGDVGALVARKSGALASESYYALMLRQNAASDTVSIVKVASAVRSILAGPTAITLTSGDVWKFELRGSTLKGYEDGVERITASDGDISAKGVVGIGFGAMGTDSTDNVAVDWDVDDFTLTDAAAAAASCGSLGLLGVGC